MSHAMMKECAYSAGSVIATADSTITADLDTSHAVLVSAEGLQQDALFDVPDAQGGVSRA